MASRKGKKRSGPSRSHEAASMLGDSGTSAFTSFLAFGASNDPHDPSISTSTSASVSTSMPTSSSVPSGDLFASSSGSATASVFPSSSSFHTPPEFATIFKKMNKKDTTTKLKAIRDLNALLLVKEDGNEVDCVLALAEYPVYFNRLAYDPEPRVRVAILENIGVWIRVVKKGFAPFLKLVIIAWLANYNDHRREVSSCAKRVLEESFGEKVKSVLDFTKFVVIDTITQYIEENHPLFCAGHIRIFGLLVMSDISFDYRQTILDQKWTRSLLKNTDPQIREALLEVLAMFLSKQGKSGGLSEDDHAFLSHAMYGSLQEKSPLPLVPAIIGSAMLLKMFPSDANTQKSVRNNIISLLRHPPQGIMKNLQFLLTTWLECLVSEQESTKVDFETVDGILRRWMTIIFNECLAEEISVMEIPQVLDIFSKTIGILRKTFSKEEIQDFLLDLGHQIVASVLNPPRGRRSMYLKALLDVIDIDSGYHAPLLDSLFQEELLVPIIQKKEHSRKYEGAKEVLDIVRSLGSKRLRLMPKSNQFLARLFVEVLHFEGISLIMKSIPETLQKEVFPTLDQVETFLLHISERGGERIDDDQEVLHLLTDLWEFGIEKSWRVPLMQYLFKFFSPSFCLGYLVRLIEWETSDGNGAVREEFVVMNNPYVVAYIVDMWRKCENKQELDIFRTLFKTLETHDHAFLSKVFDGIQPITMEKDTHLRWEKICQFLSFRFDRGIVSSILRDLVVNGTFVADDDEEDRARKMLEFERTVCASFEKSLTHQESPLQSVDADFLLRSLRILCKESISNEEKDDTLVERTLYRILFKISRAMKEKPLQNASQVLGGLRSILSVVNEISWNVVGDGRIMVDLDESGGEKIQHICYSWYVFFLEWFDEIVQEEKISIPKAAELVPKELVVASVIVGSVLHEDFPMQIFSFFSCEWWTSALDELLNEAPEIHAIVACAMYSLGWKAKLDTSDMIDIEQMLSLWCLNLDEKFLSTRLSLVQCIFFNHETFKSAHSLIDEDTFALVGYHVAISEEKLEAHTGSQTGNLAALLSAILLSNHFRVGCVESVEKHLIRAWREEALRGKNETDEEKKIGKMTGIGHDFLQLVKIALLLGLVHKKSDGVMDCIGGLVDKMHSEMLVFSTSTLLNALEVIKLASSEKLIPRSSSNAMTQKLAEILSTLVEHPSSSSSSSSSPSLHNPLVRESVLECLGYLPCNSDHVSIQMLWKAIGGISSNRQEVAIHVFRKYMVKWLSGRYRAQNPSASSCRDDDFFFGSFSNWESEFKDVGLVDRLDKHILRKVHAFKEYRVFSSFVVMIRSWTEAIATIQSDSFSDNIDIDEEESSTSAESGTRERDEFDVKVSVAPCEDPADAAGVFRNEGKNDAWMAPKKDDGLRLMFQKLKEERMIDRIMNFIIIQMAKREQLASTALSSRPVDSVESSKNDGDKRDGEESEDSEDSEDAMLMSPIDSPGFLTVSAVEDEWQLSLSSPMEVVDEESFLQTCLWVLLFMSRHYPKFCFRWWQNMHSVGLKNRAKDIFSEWICEKLIEIEWESLRTIQISGEMVKVSILRETREIVFSFYGDEMGNSVRIVFEIPPTYPLERVKIAQTESTFLVEALLRQWTVRALSTNDQKCGYLGASMLELADTIRRFFRGKSECPICLSVLHSGSMKTPDFECPTCHHKFHTACLFHWFSTSGAMQCPMCRSLVNGPAG